MTSPNTIFCFECAKEYTSDDKFFVYLSCREILCYNCSKIDKNNFPENLNVCPYYGRDEVEVVDLGDEICENINSIISGVGNILDSVSIEQFIKNMMFKDEQLKVLRNELIEKKSTISSKTKLVKRANEEVSRVKNFLVSITNKEKVERGRVKLYYRKHKCIVRYIDYKVTDEYL